MTRALITGASRGIGRAVALRLAAGDVEVLVHGRDRAALERTCNEVEARGGRARPLAFDLADADAVEALIAAVGREPLDVLVNNAGTAAVGSVAELSPADWQRSLAVNVTAPFLLCRSLAQAMPAGGVIVNVLSVAVRAAFPGWAAYAASKAALQGLSRVLREELRGRGVKVVDVVPAATATDLWDDVPGHWPREGMLPPDEVAEAIHFAIGRPAAVVADEIVISTIAGNL